MSKFNLNDYEAVVLDFDGTLVDSLGLWHRIDVVYLARFGIECPEKLSENINGMSFTETAAYFKERFDLPLSIEEIKRDWIELSHDYYMQEIEFKPGAKVFLKTLKESKKPVALATSNNAELTEPYFKKHGIDWIDFFSYSCDCENGKPDPEVYLRAAQGLGVDPKKCLVFEDSLEGVTGAKNAGMRVVAVRDKYNAHIFDSICERADFCIDDYTDLE